MDQTDRLHNACRELISRSREPLIIPSPVLVELDQWCVTRLGRRAFLELLRQIRQGNFQVEDLLAADYERVAEIVTQYADTPVGFVDAAVLAVVERFVEPKLATIDHRHFRMLRPRHVDALTLLP